MYPDKAYTIRSRLKVPVTRMIRFEKCTKIMKKIQKRAHNSKNSFITILVLFSAVFLACMLLRTAYLLFHTTGIFYWKVFYQRGLPLVIGASALCLIFCGIIFFHNRSAFQKTLKTDRKKCDFMIILGIDPGIAIVGYGIIEHIGNRYKTIAYDSILTPAHTPDQDRLKSIYTQLRQIIYDYKPEVCAIEKLYYNNNAKTVIQVAQGRGVAILAAANEGLKVYEYTPLQIKQSLTGYGRADKKQMQQMTKMILGLDKVPKPDDTADALAVAICHSHYAAYNMLNERLEELK